MRDLAETLERDEGLEEQPYRDTEGIWTFGVGRNLEANPITGPEWKALLDAGEISVTLTPPGARRLLRNGIVAATAACARTFFWWPRLDDVRREAIANLVFNMGIQRFGTFRKLIEAMNHCDYETAADELQDSRWFGQVGARGPRLVKQLRDGVRQ
jgi:lysozyme